MNVNIFERYFCRRGAFGFEVRSCVWDFDFWISTPDPRFQDRFQLTPIPDPRFQVRFQLTPIPDPRFRFGFQLHLLFTLYATLAFCNTQFLVFPRYQRRAKRLSKQPTSLLSKSRYIVAVGKTLFVLKRLKKDSTMF